jgi:hypothetical protein
LTRLIPVLLALSLTVSIASAEEIVDLTAGLQITSSVEHPRPNAGDNSITRRIELETPPDLYVSSFPPQFVDPGLAVPVRVVYANQARTPATGVVVTIEASGAQRILEMPSICTAAGTRITCTIGDLPYYELPNHLRELDFVFLAPDVSAARMTLDLTIRGNEEELDPGSNTVFAEIRTYRTFFVTNVADDGEGSLRQVIRSSNAQCGDDWLCKIAFRIEPGANEWLTLRPLTPLPVVRNAVTVDAAMQTKYFGDTNPVGPEIEISGERLAEGSGLEVERCSSVRGLVINRFPGSGVLVRCTGVLSQTIEGNYLGTDPTGTHAAPNMRGITFDAPPGGDRTQLRNNVISGNYRSGVFVQSGEVRIAGNVIGLTRGATAPLGNGASGIYLGPEAYGCDVVDNYIGFNHHAGVSLDRESSYSSMRGNSLQANWGLAFDFGLDGPSGQVPDASAGVPVLRPIITSARYEPATDQTVIEGTSETWPARHEVWIAVYANDAPDPSGYGEGQYYLGEVMADSERRFTLRYPGHTPGRFIAATTTRINIIGLAKTPELHGIDGSGFTTQTSEFSLTVEVR